MAHHAPHPSSPDSSSVAQNSAQTENSDANPSVGRHRVAIARSDRWSVYHRLQELDIPCDCLADGSLHVEVSSPIAALQLRSVLHQIQCSRPQLAQWLDHCWQIS